MYKNIKLFLPPFFFLFVLFLSCSINAQEKIHTVFFEGTDHELNVYRIHGKESGKTLLLIGGIQGDEPGGFISADLYADLSLAKGNLIVVPRANFHSILLKRRKINEDMNRKFAEDKKDNYETKVVSILKKLIAESDCLLNLHDGSGFYSEKWESPERNPKRYGQSLIADCDVFTNPDTGKVINLGDMGKKVAGMINKDIKNPDYHFHFNNHNTKLEDSLHKEQRKSATYYALYKWSIPAFGVESSKSLPLETKVLHHNLAINAFMDLLGVVPESPGFNLEDPELRYLIVSVNNSLPILVEKDQTLYLNKGDSIMISHIEANYERGLSADIIGYGTVNDLRKKIVISKPAKVIVRKDYFSCGSINVAFDWGRKKASNNVSISNDSEHEAPFLYFKLNINGKNQICQNNEFVSIVKGDKLKIVDVFTNLAYQSDCIVNFKGYVGEVSKNIGEDRGFIIYTERDLWKNYSLNKDGKIYQIVVTRDNDQIGKLFIKLETPVLKYLVLGKGDEKKYCYVPGDTISIDQHMSLQLIDIIVDTIQSRYVKAFITGPGSFKKMIKINQTVDLNSLISSNNKTSGSYRIDIQQNDIILGSVMMNFLREMKSEKR